MRQFEEIQDNLRTFGIISESLRKLKKIEKIKKKVQEKGSYLTLESQHFSSNTYQNIEHKTFKMFYIFVEKI